MASKSRARSLNASPNDYKDVTPEQREQIEKLLEKFEDDDDVQNVFHNMKEDETEGEEE